MEEQIPQLRKDSLTNMKDGFIYTAKGLFLLVKGIILTFILLTISMFVMVKNMTAKKPDHRRIKH